MQDCRMLGSVRLLSWKLPRAVRFHSGDGGCGEREGGKGQKKKQEIQKIERVGQKNKPI